MLKQQTVLVNETRGPLIDEETGLLKVRGELGCWSQWLHGFRLATTVTAERTWNTLIFPPWIGHGTCATCAKQDTSSLHALTDMLWDDAPYIALFSCLLFAGHKSYVLPHTNEHFNYGMVTRIFEVDLA